MCNSCSNHSSIDNLINQKVLSKALRRLGLTVHIANHGQEALDFLRTTRHWNAAGENARAIGHFQIDGVTHNMNDNQNNSTRADPSKNRLRVILMDLEMPVMDGLTCTREIRRLEKSGLLVDRLTIIAITANARAEQVATALAAGMVC